MDKIAIRKKIRSDRENLSPDFVAKASGKISELFFGLECVEKASDILLYADFKNEVHTSFVLSKLIYMGKNVYLPKTVGDDIVILPFSPDRMETGKYGIAEPEMDLNAVVPYSRPDIIVVPGIAFDRSGGRIGFGKGYYDRMLEKKSDHARAVAFAYDMQIVNNVYSEPHDVPMDYIITEKEIIEISGGAG